MRLNVVVWRPLDNAAEIGKIKRYAPNAGLALPWIAAASYAAWKDIFGLAQLRL